MPEHQHTKKRKKNKESNIPALCKVSHYRVKEPLYYFALFSVKNVHLWPSGSVNSISISIWIVKIPPLVHLGEKQATRDQITGKQRVTFSHLKLKMADQQNRPYSIFWLYKHTRKMVFVCFPQTWPLSTLQFDKHRMALRNAVELTR